MPGIRLQIDGTRLLRETLACKAKLGVHEGGSSSSKTYSLAQAHILWSCKEERQTYSIVRKTLPAMKRGALKDFRDALERAAAVEFYGENKSDIYFVNRQTQTQIEFFALDNPQKARGPRRDRLWLNEANEMSYDDFRQLSLRTRGPIWLDYNPSMQRHWIYDHVQTREDCHTIHSTYEDNAFLSQENRREIEVLMPVYEEGGRLIEDHNLTYTGRGRLVRGDPYQWGVFGLGRRGAPSEAIYPYVYEGPFPEGMETVLGLDFGYNHAMVLVRLARVDHEGLPWLHVDELVHESYLTTEDLLDRLPSLGVHREELIFADGSRPDSIETMQRAGYNVTAAEKGSGSVYEGIQFVKSHRLVFTARSQRSKEQHQDYRWKKLLDDTVTDQPVKLNDDACFPAGTLVQTRHGEREIQHVRPGDMVLTRSGYKRVLKAGLTSLAEDVFAFDMPNGRTLHATTNHPVFTLDRGFVPICTLIPSDTLCILGSIESPIISGGKLWPKLALKYAPFTAFDTGVIPAPSTDSTAITSCAHTDAVSAESNCFTGLFGPITMDLFQKAITFITGTATALTTHWKTLLRFQHAPICRVMPKKAIIWAARHILGSSRQPLKQLRSGTAAIRAEHGTVNMPGESTRHALTSAIPANNAAPALKAGILKSPVSAQISASRHGEGLPVLTTKPVPVPGAVLSLSSTDTAKHEPAPIPALQRCVGRRVGSMPVYNLTIEDCPEFFAEGVLVHNCDAVRYGAFSYWGAEAGVPPTFILY